VPHLWFAGIALWQTDVQAVLNFCALYITTPTGFCTFNSVNNASSDEYACRLTIQFHQCCDCNLYSSLCAVVQVFYCVLLLLLSNKNKIAGTNDKRCWSCKLNTIEINLEGIGHTKGVNFSLNQWLIVFKQVNWLFSCKGKEQNW